MANKQPVSPSPGSSRLPRQLIGESIEGLEGRGTSQRG